LKFTHEQLVNVARKWLARRHVVITTELACGAEEADALGFRHNGRTTLIECKTSVSDFRADARKLSRCYPEMGLGAERYYLVPEEILSPVLQALPARWGALSWNGRRVEVACESEHFPERNHEREKQTLISALRRCARPNFWGVNVRCYTVQSDTRPRATLGVVPPD
jgi:hypothetical protein